MIIREIGKKGNKLKAHNVQVSVGFKPLNVIIMAELSDNW